MKRSLTLRGGNKIAGNRRPTPNDEDVRWQEFQNEPDTDFSLVHNVEWAEQIVESWQNRYGDQAADIPLVIAGEKVADQPGTDERKLVESRDPSRPGVVIARYRQANATDIQRAVQCATEDEPGWRRKSASERRAVLAKVAHEMRAARGELVGASMADGGKIVAESDPEISEAIDFVDFYSKTAEYFATEVPGLVAYPRGVVVVVSPWNFPVAIPCGGVAAALAAGNTVILKPASDTVLVAHELCQCFWRAGVSPKTLQLVPCSGGHEGQQLVTHADVDTVILTGGTETALKMLSAKPSMRLFAETGGKNATVVTGMADRDQAIKNVIQSAFGHSGQKCSATSLLILEAEVYDDPSFKRALCDAVTSLTVGTAWDLKTKIGPLINAPSGVLETSLKELEDHESWAVIPRRDRANPGLYSPAVKWGVQPGSFTHCTEFFGPVLGVMRANNLHEAIDLVNQTGYGLTSGIETLDDREREIWRESVRAGNLYINRGTTGAIVLRQPFGGMGKSAFGPGIKAGGPNYTAQLMHFDNDSTATFDPPLVRGELAELCKELQAADGHEPFRPGEVQPIVNSTASYQKYFDEEFGVAHDDFKLVGQDNIRRYLPVREIRIRIHPDDSPFEILARVCAARVAGCRITVSAPLHRENPAGDRPIVNWPIVNWLDGATESWAGAIEFVEETDQQLADAIRGGHTLRVRYAGHGRVPTIIREAAAETGLFIADEPVLAHGRVELLWYFEEQSISDNYHRYGNLGDRSAEPRAAIL